MKIIDMHCDTLSAMLNRKRQGQTYGLDQHHTQISLDWMQRLSASKLCRICQSGRNPNTSAGCTGND